MKAIIIALIVLASALYAFGAACPTATYDNYLVANYTCGIDDKTFYDFMYSTAGTNPMPSSSIMVNPLNVPLNPGFLFNAPWGVQAGQTQDSFVGFTVGVNQGGNDIKDLSLQMFGAGFLGTGQVSVSETYCAGDTFADGCLTGVEGTLLTILNASTSKLYDSVTFAKTVKIVDVRKDIELLGGSDGSASLLSGVQNQFSEVPEPGSMLLMSTGALGLAGVLRRRLRM